MAKHSLYLSCNMLPLSASAPSHVLARLYMNHLKVYVVFSSYLIICCHVVHVISAHRICALILHVVRQSLPPRPLRCLRMDILSDTLGSG